MRLTLLGTGDAAGMPVYGCHCERCVMARENPDYRRGPTSALLEIDDKRYLIDAGLMDIADRFPAPTLDGIFLTHFHPDHVQGLFHLRWGRGNKIPVYCPTDNTGFADLLKHPGVLDFQVLRKYEPLNIGELTITPVPLIHSKPTFGYLFEKEGHQIAYLVDTKDIPPRVEEFLREKQLETVIIDTCSPPGVENRNHNNLDDTLSLHQRIGAKKTIMTHIQHDFDLWLTDNCDSLPETVIPGYDGYIAYYR
ncbi:MAG TPA: phosphonate metabolism protein PhnP [Gammaproteobacteria bacterium]|nr:phosphonate metabolism protein PhnP [Gammaproteobacteria bacterium]